ncbi:MAG: YlbF family regulator [Gemmatimonadota bacterium]|jgi:cell fate (sporulation/competence/biofilm development) regulator YlbF (YheA/YmcA/DUF963 family)
METNDRERIFDKAGEVGRLIAATAEYRTLKSAHREIGDDRESTGMLNRMRELQESIIGYLGRDEEPPHELEQELAALTERVQENPRFRSLITAQERFDELRERIDEAIGRGIVAGEKSGIIVP